LLARRRALLRQIAHGERDRLAVLDDAATNDPIPNEEGQDDEIADELAVLDARAQEEVMAIDRALARIETDEFGYCTRRGEVIPLARLQALPTAELCLDCAEELEAEQRAARGPVSRTM